MNIVKCLNKPYGIFRSYDLRNISPNLPRYRKGYRYEMYNQNLMDRNGIKYEANPKSFTKWVKYTNKGYDAKVQISNKMREVEYKYLTKGIYTSWLKRDWISRSANYIVTNNKWLLTWEQRKLLKENRKKLFNDLEFIWYCLEKNRKLCSFLKDMVTRYILNGYSYSLNGYIIYGKTKIKKREVNKKPKIDTDPPPVYSKIWLILVKTLVLNLIFKLKKVMKWKINMKKT